MVRHVYSSFHYDDVWRANVVRNSNTLKSTATEIGFYDNSLWEEAKTKGDAEIQKLIDNGMVGASVTIVLIGSQTYERPWVLYETEKSYTDGMGLVAIHVNSVKDRSGSTKSLGPNPLADVQISSGLFGSKSLSSVYRTYDWIRDDGYNNVARWIEEAAAAAGR